MIRVNLTFKSLLLYGPTIQVFVCPLEVPEKPEDLKLKPVFALLDTGASSSMIDEHLATELQLVPVDKWMCSGVGGLKEHVVYLARIVAPQLDIEQYGQFMAAHLKDGGQEQEVLLGRDFLNRTVMIYDGVRAQVTIASAKIS